MRALPGSFSRAGKCNFPRGVPDRIQCSDRAANSFSRTGWPLGPRQSLDGQPLVMRGDARSARPYEAASPEGDIARKLGFTMEELSEVFQQMAPFTGFPAPMLGIRLLKEAFLEP